MSKKKSLFGLTRLASAMKKKMDEDHKTHEKIINRVRDQNHYDTIFDNWKRSIDGKEWKLSEFIRCENKCASCGDKISKISSAVIHHNLSRKNWGHEANFIENFSLLCLSCNSKYQSKDTNFNGTPVKKTVIY
jgi:5-methylcytosine-specific restriction endonuclease McrA